MKVLFVQNIEGIAGSEKYFWHLLPSLKKSGIEVAFLCVYKKEFSGVAGVFCDQLIKEDIDTHKIQAKSYLSLTLLRRIKKIILEKNIDILHSHLIYADFWSAVLRSYFGVRVISVSTLHGYQEDVYTKFCLNPGSVPKNRYYRVAQYAYKRIDHVYACSEGLKDFFLEAGIRFKNPVEVIHHGFDYPAISPVNKSTDGFICAIPGRLIPRKGHQLVLKHGKQLYEKIPGFRLKIIGDGPLRQELEDYVSANHLKACIVFTGNVPDVRPALSESDLVLVPSYAEGLPLVIFEAMSVARPVIAFDTIGPAEVVRNGITGYKIKPFDDQAFIEKIIELAGDKQLALTMGAEGKRIVESEFSLAAMTGKTIVFYQTCLKSRPFLTM